MASSKVMKSSNTRNPDLSRRSSITSSSSSTKPQQQLQLQQQQQQQQEVPTDSSNFAPAMTVDGILRNVYNAPTASTTDATLLDAQISLIETNDHPNPHHQHHPSEDQNGAVSSAIKSVDDVWREIVSGDRKEMKEEAIDELMTLEDFLAKAGAVEDEEAAAAAAAIVVSDVDVKAVPIMTERMSGGVYSFDPPPSPFQVDGSIVGFGNGVEVISGISGGGGGGGGGGGRGKRGRLMLEPLDKAAQQRQRRMIKNRESAARSRERKQAYQVELESLAVRLEEENERLLKEKAERTKERYKQLMEKVIPIVEKQRQPRVLRRVRSMEW